MADQETMAVPLWLSRRTDLSPGDRWIAAVINWRQGQNGCCWASLQDIATDAGLKSEREARSAVARLVQKGSVSTKRRCRQTTLIQMRESLPWCGESTEGIQQLESSQRRESNTINGGNHSVHTIGYENPDKRTQKVTLLLQQGGVGGNGLSLPTEKDGEYQVPDEMLREWRAAFPELDVPAEIRKARVWCLSDPGNLKTARGMKTFLTGWFGRAKDPPPYRNGKPRGKPEINHRIDYQHSDSDPEQAILEGI